MPPGGDPLGEDRWIRPRGQRCPERRRHDGHNAERGAPRRRPRHLDAHTAEDPAQKKDIEETLKLNTGDLPELREAAFQAFCKLQRAHAPKEYGKPARRAFFSIWVKRETPKLPEMLGVIELMIRE